MLCCLNPNCQKPQNLDETKVCINCGSPLTSLLRGRYRPAMLLGQGGFGRTYLATDEDRLSTKCVIKQFSPQVQGTKSLQKAVQLFNQEAVRLHELGEHPQIPTLLAYFEQDKYLYLVQQFIEGQSLTQQIRRQGTFSEQQIREVLSDLLPVLQFVHDHQVIHRDITPSNVLRRQLDQRLILIDFGVAKQINQNEGALTGTRIGTEGYAPMEQFRSGRAYPASDLYSLGATCLHLLTGTRPDNLYDPLRGRWIWREYLHKKGIGISDRLSYILDRLLRDLVNERYQSATDVLKDLGTVTPVSSAQTAPIGVFPTRPVSGQPSASRSGARMRIPPSRPPTSRPMGATPPTTQPPDSLMPTEMDGASGIPRSGSVRSGVPSGSPSSQGCLYTLQGHSSWVTCVVVSPDARTIATSSLDDSIKLWNLATGELITTLTGHSRAVNTIAISPDGKMLVSGSDDYTIKFWNLATGDLLCTLTGHSRDVNSLAVSPDGRILASGGEDRTVRLWQLGTGAPLRTLFGVAGMIKSIATSPNGKVLVSGGFDNKIKLWSLQTGEQIKAWNAHRNSVNSVSVSPDSQILASGSKDRTINLWSLETGQLIRTLAGHSRDVNSVCFTPDGKTLISGSSDNTIQFWDVSTGNSIAALKEHIDAVNSIALSPDGQLVISGSSDKLVKVWKMPKLA